MTARFRPPSIKDEGLDKYLDRTASEHNGYTFTDFVKFINHPYKMGDSAIGKLYGRHRLTIRNWRQLYREKQVSADKALEKESK